MRELILMERGSERLYVPSEKAQIFFDQGWKEISRKPMDDSVAVETAMESAVESRPEKSRRTSKV